MLFMMQGSPPAGLVYHIGRQLYVGLTNSSLGLSLIESRGKSFTMDPSYNFSPLPAGYAPEPDDVADAIQPFLDNPSEFDRSITFAGLGEPLLEIDTLVSSIGLVKHRNPDLHLTFGVNTNGIVDNNEEVVRSLRGEVNRVTVALNYDNRENYEQEMGVDAFSGVCDFISQLAAVEDLETTVTVVDNGVADVAGVQRLANEMSVACRVRSYFA